MTTTATGPRRSRIGRSTASEQHEAAAHGGISSRVESFLPAVGHRALSGIDNPRFLSVRCALMLFRPIQGGGGIPKRRYRSEEIISKLREADVLISHPAIVVPDKRTLPLRVGTSPRLPLSTSRPPV